MAIATRWLLKLGILHDGSLEEILRAGTIRAFFPHGLGHHVGLEVHDVLNVPIQAETQAKLEVVDTELYKDTELASLSAEEIKDLYDALIYSIPKLRPVQADGPHLEPGMVVTVEPGLYFSDFALSKVYLRDRTHAKYINKNVLAKYMPVGGVRIEDDILVTTDGYENLTTAPKGEEALKIIRGEVEEKSLGAAAGDTSSCLATPFTFRSAPPVDNGKAPMTSTPHQTAEPKDEKIFQLCSELSAKCSIDVKQKSADCLPPRLESESLIYSFPFATAMRPSHPPERSDSQLLDQMLHKQAELNSMIRNAAFKKPDLWTRQLQSGRKPSLDSVAMQEQLKDVMTRLRNMHHSLDQWRKGSDLIPRSSQSRTTRSVPSTETTSGPSTTAQEPTPVSANTWEEPLALSANQEKILLLLRSMGHAEQGLELSYISREAGLATDHARIILDHLGSRGLVRMSRCGNKFKAVGRSPRLVDLMVSGSTELELNADADDEQVPVIAPESATVSSTKDATSSQLVTALYDFKQDDDQNCLVFEKGDVILITERSESGWCLGLHRRSGKLGWLPANYVEETAAPVTSPSPVEVPGVSASPSPTENDQHAQIRQVVIKERLQSVFSKKLASLLLPSPASSIAVDQQSIVDALVAATGSELPCFSGLCMQAKQKFDEIDFTALEGSGIHKFKKLYKEVDKALALEFDPGHLFYRLGQEERDKLYATRWQVLGVKEETVEQFGICGACSVCRQGFIHWDEKWLADGDHGDDDDDE
jgi:hypothetical protein